MCDIKQFCQAVSSPSPFFHTQAQYDLFWGMFERAKMCQNQKWLDWGFMMKFERLHALLTKIEEAGLKKAMKLQHN